jgi:anti-sigma regulatory factor (Ser/Thr protein kinase)
LLQQCDGVHGCGLPGRSVTETVARADVRTGSDLAYPGLIETKTTLSPYPTSVGAARRFVRDVLSSRRVVDDVVETVELLTSEVVTNAIVHAGSAPELVVRVRRDRVRVEVNDKSPAVPVVRVVDPAAVSGRGMVIVEELAGAWGVEHIPRGKRVWFEVAR